MNWRADLGRDVEEMFELVNSLSEKTIGEIGPLLDQRKEENVRLNDRPHLVSMNEGGDSVCLASGDQRAEEG